MATALYKLIDPTGDLDALATTFLANVNVSAVEIVGGNQPGLANPSTARSSNNVQILVTGTTDAAIVTALTTQGLQTKLQRVTNAEAALDSEA